MAHLDSLPLEYDGGWIRRCDDADSDLEFYIEEDDRASGDGEREGNGAVMASIMAMGQTFQSRFDESVDVAVTKSNTSTTYEVGDVLEYSISVTASGVSCGSAPGVGVQDTLIGNVQVVDTDCAANSLASCVAGQAYSTSANNVDIVSAPYLIDLGINGQVDFTMQVQVVE